MFHLPFSSYTSSYIYQLKMNDSLMMTIGDVITVTEKCEGGWYKGVLNNNPVEGLFPPTYCEELPPRRVLNVDTKKTSPSILLLLHPPFLHVHHHQRDQPTPAHSPSHSTQYNILYMTSNEKLSSPHVLSPSFLYYLLLY